MGFNVDEFPGGLSYAKLSQILTDAGYLLPVFEQNVSGGLVTGQSTRRQPLVSANRRLAIGLSTKLLDYQFAAASMNTNIWKCLFATMTMTQSANALLMNANSTATITTGCQLSTWRYFNLVGNGTTQLEIEVQFTATPLANQMWLGGFFPSASATALPTDGVYFKFSSAGLVGISNFANTETATAVLVPAVTMPYNQNINLKIDVSAGNVDFWVNDVLLATLTPAAANPQPCAISAQPITFQQYNPGTVSGSPQMQTKIGSVLCTQRDIATEKLWEVQQGLAGLIASQGSEGVIGTTALYGNNLAAGAGAAMTNTTAALTAGFGGQFTSTGTLAQGTDGILQSYQNPAGGVNQTPRTILVKGVWIHTGVSATITGGPVLMAYSLAYGHTNVNMTTAESGSFVTATAKAPRRIPLGMETIPVTSVAGFLAAGVYRTFNVPVPVNPGEFIAVCAKNLGTVMSAGTLTSLVGFDACYE